MCEKIWNKSNLITFLGLIFATVGIAYCYTNKVAYAIVLLILAGICDAFDGAWAKRTNKSNSSYGVELDSLADIISSGILPVSICLSLGFNKTVDIIFYVIFIICGITRLAYYNVNSSDSNYFSGVPITFSTILIPLVYIITKSEWVYLIALGALSVAYVSDIKIKKPNLKIKIVLSVIGILAAILIIIFKFLQKGV